MNSFIKLPPQEMRDEVRFMADAPNQPQARNPMVEWRVFLKMVEAVCQAYGWDLEFDSP